MTFKLLIADDAADVAEVVAFGAQMTWPDCRDTHYLKVFVRRLRQKLGDDSEHPRYIQTEWGSGYRFIAPR
jgi:DNA-binding response OmpR family regulator